MNAQVDLNGTLATTNSNNLDLWREVFITDPAAVKPITGKSYKGSSPKPYWIVEQATKHFGPCGIGWGVEVLSESYINCGPKDVIHSAVVKVWYVWNGVRGEVQQVGGTKVAYETSTGKYMVDEDAAKKSVTDGMIKCLSMIGFAGDIFSGRWDDSKYVAEAAEHHQQQRQAEAAQHQQKQLEAEFNIALRDIENAQDKSVFLPAWNYFKSTPYADEIEQRIKVKLDQMGWTP